MFHTKNLTFIINVLLDNDYPLTFISDTINQRIKNLLKNKHIVRKDLIDNVRANKFVSWLTVPFIPFHTEKFKRFKETTSELLFIVLIKWVNT